MTQHGRTFTCERDGCDATGWRRTGCYNRARRGGHPLYCSRKCAGLVRRSPPLSEAEQKARKAAYDRKRRAEKADEIREAKRAYYQANKHRLYAAHCARMESDPDYRAMYEAAKRQCMGRPEWKAHKRAYDRRWRAEREYGEFADAHVALMELYDEIGERIGDRAEIYQANGLFDKRRTRRRDHGAE